MDDMIILIVIAGLRTNLLPEELDGPIRKPFFPVCISKKISFGLKKRKEAAISLNN